MTKVICPDKQECKNPDCMHYVPHEPVNFGQGETQNCCNQITLCPLVGTEHKCKESSMSDVEKLARVILSPQGADDANLRLSRLNVSGEKAHFVAKIVLDAGYLPVEPTQLEALSDEEINMELVKYASEICQSNPIKEWNYTELIRLITKATIEKNSKEQLYRLVPK